MTRATGTSATETRAFRVLMYGLILASAAAQFALVPVMPDYAHRLGLSGFQQGLVLGATGLATLAVSVPDWPAFPDSAEALERLGRRFKLIILSNVDRDSFASSSKRLGVTFTSIITAQDVGCYKPSARNFEALDDEIRRLGIAKRKLLHVAQSLFHDHVPAKQAGLPTVWINRRHDNPGWGATPAPQAGVTPDWTFTSMAAFADAVEADPT